MAVPSSERRGSSYTQRIRAVQYAASACNLAVLLLITATITDRNLSRSFQRIEQSGEMERSHHSLKHLHDGRKVIPAFPRRGQEFREAKIPGKVPPASQSRVPPEHQSTSSCGHRGPISLRSSKHSTRRLCCNDSIGSARRLRLHHPCHLAARMAVPSSERRGSSYTRRLGCGSMLTLLGQVGAH